MIKKDASVDILPRHRINFFNEESKLNVEVQAEIPLDNNNTNANMLKVEENQSE